MNQVLKATDVRKNWSEVIDSVVRKQPVIIKRNRDLVTMLSLEQMDLVLDFFKLNLLLIKEEDGSYTGSINEMDVLGNANSKEDLIEMMIDSIIEYADEYMDNFDVYYHSTNRQSHFPYVYKIMAHETDRLKLREMFNISTED